MSERIGILLTAGAQEKTAGGYRVEPDLEGKVRAISALDALVKGQVDRLYVAGGQISFNNHVNKFYVDYLRRFSQKYNFEPSKIQSIEGEADTAGDLRKAVEVLPRGELENSKLFSSGFHLDRAAQIMKSFGYSAAKITSEEVTRQRSARYPRVVDQIYTPQFLSAMAAREKKLKLLLFIDNLPILGRLHLGLSATRVMAKLARS